MRGFTADAAYVVYDSVQKSDQTEECKLDTVNTSDLLVLELKTGAVQRFHIGAAGCETTDDEDLQAAWLKVLGPGQASAEKWLKAHPIVPPVVGRAADPKGPTLTLEQKGPPAGQWKDGKFMAHGKEAPSNGSIYPSWKKVPLTVTLETAGAKKLLASREWQYAELVVTPFWARDGSAVVLVSHQSGPGNWEGDDSLEALLPSAPSIEVLVSKGLDPASLVAALRKAGFPVAHTGPAQSAREKTVVYAAKGAEAAAAKVAAAVPGGASVQPLTWPSPAEVVIAAGPVPPK